jgi:hypothetical protein
MAKKKNEATETESGKIVIAIYSDEFEKVSEKIDTEVTGKNVREYFGLNPTHRQRTGTELREEISELSSEEKKELLEEIRKKKGKN